MPSPFRCPWCGTDPLYVACAVGMVNDHLKDCFRHDEVAVLAR
jgi:hypothetical protein